MITTEEISDLLTAKKQLAQSNNDFNDSINKKRLDATSELISLIQPILAEYADNNSISIIFQKKNIIIGKTELDITFEFGKI